MGITKELRIYSSELYIFWDKVAKVGIGTTNRSILASRSGFGYNKVRYLFGDLKKYFYEDDRCIIIKIDTDMIFKKECNISEEGLKNFGKEQL